MSISQRKCSFCGAEEGKPRPLGRFIVELSPVEGKENTYACQNCVVHEGSTSYPKMKKGIIEKIKSLF